MLGFSLPQSHNCNILIFGIPGIWAVLAGTGFYLISNEKKPHMWKLIGFIGMMLMMLAPFMLGMNWKDRVERGSSTIVDILFGVASAGGFCMYSLSVLTGNLFAQRWRDSIAVSLGFCWFVALLSLYWQHRIVPDMFKIAMLIAIAFFGTLALGLTREPRVHDTYKHETEESLLGDTEQA